MTMASSNFDPKRARQRHSAKKYNLVMLLALGGAFATVFSIFGPTFYILQQQNAATKNIIEIRMDSFRPKPRVIEVNDLANESLFQRTIKSCLKKKCKQFIPEAQPGKKKVQRVAILSAPGRIVAPLLDQAKLIMNQHNHRVKQGESKIENEIEIIPTTHVPPYGYGKTHGLTKIVRMVPQPILLEVTDALHSLLLDGTDLSSRKLQQQQAYKNITLQDVKVGLRQILRFHCRISHVAAHTALLSLELSDWRTDRLLATGTLQNFLSPALGEGEKQQSTDDGGQDKLYNAPETTGSLILTHLQAVNSDLNVMQVLDQVLMEEMKSTKNMTAWPCPSFWAAGDPPNSLQLSPLTQKLARALSPACDDDPLISCFVARDKCEAAGDGSCKGHK